MVKKAIKPYHSFFIWAFLALFIFLFTGHCQKYDVTNVGPSGNCTTDEEFFQRKIWGPVLQAKGCFGCHSSNGVAQSQGVKWSLSQDNANLDFAALKGVAQRSIDGQPLLRKKVVAAKDGVPISHGGGNFFPNATGDDAVLLDDLDEFINRSRNPTACSKDVVAYKVLYMVNEYDYARTLRRAKIALTGKIPTKGEETQVIEKGRVGFLSVLDSIMKTDEFYDRLRELFNDVIHTDNYLYDPNLNRYFDAYGQLNENLYPSRDWFLGFNATSYDASISATAGLIKNCPFGVDESTRPDKLGCLRRRLRDYTNFGIAREPIEIMVDVVKNEQPFHKILTVPYTLVNAFSARAYGLSLEDKRVFPDSALIEQYDEKKFFRVQLYQDELDPIAFRFEKKQPIRKIAIPHSGLLTTQVFLARYPTSRNNVNRHRSNFYFLFFLDTNILTLAQQLDAFGDQEDNPTLTNPTCAVCHTVMDPVAGLFKNYRRGNYYVHESWFHDKDWVRGGNFRYTEMRPPGMSEENTLPVSRSGDSLRWLGEQTGKDPRFVKAIVKMMFFALIGREPMKRPSNVDRPPNISNTDWESMFQKLNQAYLLQDRNIQEFEKSFVESNYNLKSLIKDIILSPYFRASNARNFVSNDVRLRDIGINRMLSPEQLNRKISSVMGFSWNPGWGADYLMNRYRFLYGGIDSRNVLNRPEQPSGIMVNIQNRMANQMACKAVVLDFTFLDHSRRNLLPLVETTYVPDKDGVEYPQAKKKIKDNIKYLHKLILGEYLPDDDPELERTYQLFYLTLREARGTISGMPGWAANDQNNTKDNSDLKCMKYFGANIPQGRVSISKDPNFTIRAWQAVVAYLLSDYRFVYE